MSGTPARVRGALPALVAAMSTIPGCAPMTYDHPAPSVFNQTRSVLRISLRAHGPRGMDRVEADVPPGAPISLGILRVDNTGVDPAATARVFRPGVEAPVCLLRFTREQDAWMLRESEGRIFAEPWTAEQEP